MTKIVRILLIVSLSLFAAFALFISFIHLRSYIFSKQLNVVFYDCMVLLLGVSTTLSTTGTAILLPYTMPPKQKLVYGICALCSLASACLTVVVFTFFNLDLKADKRISVPTVSTLFVVFVVLAIAFGIISLLAPRSHRPTKAERIAELEKQVAELKEQQNDKGNE